MAKEPARAGAEGDAEQPANATPATPVCGVIMPISGSDDYSDEHWRRVQRIILKAVEKAGMQPRLVWENPEVDVIHSRILQNIYECDVIICDVSGLNPNVMLELGLRLSTKRPTIVITDGEVKPPFDLAVFQYHQYQKDLEYNSLDAFIEQMANKINQVDEAYRSDRYKSFVENFTFQVVEPTEVSVPAEEALRDKIDAIARQMKRLDMRLSSEPAIRYRERFSAPVKLTFNAALVSTQVDDAVAELRTRKGVIDVTAQDKKQGFGQLFVVTISPSLSASEASELGAWIKATLARIEDDVPF